MDSVRAALVDYRLADGYSGLTFARALKARIGSRRYVTIVAGDTSTQRLHVRHESGFAVLHKPLAPGQFLAAVR